jgi:hypothetical protein
MIRIEITKIKSKQCGRIDRSPNLRLGDKREQEKC